MHNELIKLGFIYNDRKYIKKLSGKPDIIVNKNSNNTWDCSFDKQIYTNYYEYGIIQHIKNCVYLQKMYK